VLTMRDERMIPIVAERYGPGSDVTLLQQTLATHGLKERDELTQLNPINLRLEPCSYKDDHAVEIYTYTFRCTTAQREHVRKRSGRTARWVPINSLPFRGDSREITHVLTELELQRQVRRLVKGDKVLFRSLNTDPTHDTSMPWAKSAVIGMVLENETARRSIKIARYNLDSEQYRTRGGRRTAIQRLDGTYHPEYVGKRGVIARTGDIGPRETHNIYTVRAEDIRGVNVLKEAKINNQTRNQLRNEIHGTNIYHHLTSQRRRLIRYATGITEQ